MSTMNGRVKWFSSGKGYGFIESDGRDYFIHFREIQIEGFKTLDEGDKVSFVPSKSSKGHIATNVVMGHTV